jgi:hypothetical protein
VLLAKSLSRFLFFSVKVLAGTAGHFRGNRSKDKVCENKNKSNKLFVEARMASSVRNKYFVKSKN